MSRLFWRLFRFFQPRKALLFLLTVLFIASGIFAAFHLDYEEDITKVMPTDERAREFNRVMEQVSFTDKIVLSVSTQTPETEPAEKLIAAGEQVAAELENLKPGFIKEIIFRPDEAQMTDAFDLFYRFLPFYLNESDYASVDSMLTEEKIDEALSTGYRALLSPAGSFLKTTFLRDPLSMTPRALRRLQSLKSDEGLRIEKECIFSADGQQLMIYIQPENASKKTGLNGILAEKLAEIKQRVEADHGVVVSYFGAPLVAAGNASRIKTDINIIMSAVGIFLFLFLLYFYRNPFYYFILIIPAAIGASAGFLALYFLKGTASAIAMGVGGMVLGITIDYSLHVFTHFRSVKNVKTLLHDVSGGMLLSSFTTVCAFYCLLFTNSEALRDLGIFAGTGVFTAAVASLIVLPHLLKTPKKEVNEVQVNWIEKLTGYDYHKKNLVIAAGVIFTAVCVLFFNSPQFEGDPENFSYMPPELAESEAILSQGSDVSKKAVFFIASGKNMEEALSRMEGKRSIISDLRDKKLIAGISGPGELLLNQRAQQEKINRWNAFWTPEKKAFVKNSIRTSGSRLGFKETAFAGFFETLDKSFAPVPLAEFEPIQKAFLGEFVNANETGVHIVSVLKVKEVDKPAVYEAIGESDGVFMFDRKKLASDLIEIIQVDLDKLVGISSIVVFVILLISYGRIELATLTYIPLILSWVWTLGFMGILGLKFNIVNIIICTFVFGLGNDYCIFIMNGLLQDYRSGTLNLKSYKTSVFLSAFTTMLGVGAMMLSGHPALKSIAAMGVAGIGTVLFLSYAILPWLFHLLITSKTRRGMQPLTFKNAIATLWAWFMVVSGFFHLLPLGILVSISVFIPRKYRTRFIRLWLMIWARIYIGVVFMFRKTVIKHSDEKFKNPGILVANHQSFIDVVYLFSLSPRIVLTANNRIYNNPIFGPVSRMAGFLDVSQGVETMTPVIEKLIQEGNIVAIFPEGTRSTDNKIHRFHKGAFKVAQEIGADILPLVIFGTGDFLHKGEFWGRRADLFVKVMPRLKPADFPENTGYSEISKKVCALMRAEYADLLENHAGTRFHRDRLIQNYLYLNPGLEWYCRIKIKFENYYSDFHKHLPRKGKIYDLGCGYGFMAYILSFMSDERDITGCDYDEEKITTASHRFSKSDRVKFVHAGLADFTPDSCSGIVLSDVLHYLPALERKNLLQRCAASLLPDGVMLIKDADSQDTKHDKTISTENWSTRFMKFNKTTNPLYFFGADELQQIAQNLNLEIQLISSSNTTSNKIWKLSKK
ncbi:MAG: 1-acyl-sn-glycerol-3-phosphate acyltransferase [Flavobacteriales bacterium]|nr:1-acyl-sn-glycerol-3-phosphate acyltransferase [Flavobacteriales bacterium]